ncbi:unnamed protein product [Spirodela intermedia]|uniref:Pentatricopeptide repeat-containing protein n=1 Tax=Spirodela intermedia TaxID=51605 RepID=A0ABN7EC59_SPIIN|nr:unnamed protein product [Spirodela intermedia]
MPVSCSTECQQRNVVSWTSMLCALLRAGRTREAKALFDTMPQRNVVSWNAMMYARLGPSTGLAGSSGEILRRAPPARTPSAGTR